MFTQTRKCTASPASPPSLRDQRARGEPLADRHAAELLGEAVGLSLRRAPCVRSQPDDDRAALGSGGAQRVGPGPSVASPGVVVDPHHGAVAAERRHPLLAMAAK